MKIDNNIKGKLHEYFVIKLGAFDYRNNWMKCRCPFCGRELKFGINLSQDRTNCFRCGESPTPINLVKHLENLSTFQEVKSFLNSGDYDGFHFKEEKIELREKFEVYLPEGFKLISMGNSKLAKAARAYVLKRGFSINKAEEMGWGYCNKEPYFGYLIMPIMLRGQLVYYHARLFLGNGPKYRNPENTSTGIGKSQILFNADALDMYDTVYFCEGLFNAATMGIRGVASGGKSVSRYQINQVIKSQVKNVIILLDPDAKDKAIELGISLVDNKRVKVVYLPDGTDCNDLGKSKVMGIVRETPYHTYKDLMKLKSELKYE